MSDDFLTPDELRALLITVLAGASEARAAEWEKLLGEPEPVNLTFHPQSNWRLEAWGEPVRRAAVEKAVDLVREAHPYVRWQLQTD